MFCCNVAHQNLSSSLLNNFLYLFLFAVNTNFFIFAVKYYKQVAYMNLSNTAQYAIRVLSYMAVNESVIYTTSEIVSKLNLSDKYLKRLMTNLSKAGLISSIQGRYGGYKFQKSPDTIFLIDIIGSVENFEKYEGCVLGFSMCSDENPCALHHKWEHIQSEISDLFHSVTLSQILTEPNMKF